MRRAAATAPRRAGPSCSACSAAGRELGRISPRVPRPVLGELAAVRRDDRLRAHPGARPARSGRRSAPERGRRRRLAAVRRPTRILLVALAVLAAALRRSPAPLHRHRASAAGRAGGRRVRHDRLRERQLPLPALRAGREADREPGAHHLARRPRGPRRHPFAARAAGSRPGDRGLRAPPSRSAKVAPRFPNTRFALFDAPLASWTAGPGNVAAMLIRPHEAAYLAGWLAARLERARRGPDVVGVVGGEPIPPVQEFVIGYRAGARRASPGREGAHGLQPGLRRSRRSARPSRGGRSPGARARSSTSRAAAARAR